MTASNLEFPNPSEYDTFYAGYISCVTESDVLSVLHRQQAEIPEMLKELSEEDFDRRYDSRKWSLKEVIGHLIDTERLFSFRALCIARGETQSLPGFDQDDYVKAGLFETRTSKSLLAEYGAVRESSIQLFENLDPTAWSRTGLANQVTFSVRAIAFIIAGHEAHHIEVVKNRYLAT